MISTTLWLPCTPNPIRGEQGWDVASHVSVFSQLEVVLHCGCESWRKPAGKKYTSICVNWPPEIMIKLCSWGSFSVSFSAVAALVTEEVGPLTWSGIPPNHVYTTLCIQSGKQNDDWLSNSGWITSWTTDGRLCEKVRWEERRGNNNGRTLWWKTQFCKQT